MDPSSELAIRFGPPVFLLLLGYIVGTAVEKAHYRQIRIRESRLRGMPIMTRESAPAHWTPGNSTLVMGSCVVSLDYFKRFLAYLRQLFGGRISAYESLLDRARREAMLRMKEEARDAGYGAVVNVRLETARIASARRDGKGTAGVEVLAFGTALQWNEAD